MKNKHGGKKYFYKIGYMRGYRNFESLRPNNIPSWAFDAYGLGVIDGYNAFCAKTLSL